MTKQPIAELPLEPVISDDEINCYVAIEYLPVSPEGWSTDDASHEAVDATFDANGVLTDPRLELDDEQRSLLKDCFGFPIEEGGEDRLPQSVAELAKARGVSETTIRNRLDKILAELRTVYSGVLEIPQFYDASTVPGRSVIVPLGLQRGNPAPRGRDGKYLEQYWHPWGYY